jgi:VanZ family protein
MKMIKKYRFSFLLALAILVLSLAAPSAFRKVDFLDITFTDKIVHMGMYFALMSVITWESRIVFEKAGVIYIAALISFIYGILMEVFQEIFTLNRTGSIWDALFNTLGIILSIALWLVLRYYLKNKSLR